MEEKRAVDVPADLGEVVEIYRQPVPGEVVERYSRPLPGRRTPPAASPGKSAGGGCGSF